ncbi:MAG: asparagine--tRNA ligase [Myxococcota bacterium]|jgi:asparaginyl-tRNA synthetase|nr:asparagine--tRNA ligase [Myxococcota bacterium]
MTETIKCILASEPQPGIVAEGWLRTTRASKNVVFLELNDGSCLESLQAVVEASTPGFAEIAALGVGSAVRVQGDLIPSPAQGQRVELKAASVEIVGQAGADYPLQKKRHSFEFLRTIAHLRPRAKTFGAVFRVRHALQMAIHRFFDNRGFIQVHSPIITASDCEGAGQMFRVTTFDLDGQLPKDDAGKVDFKRDFFETATSLTVSGQLEGEIFALAFKNVYTFGPTFRAENSNTSRHAAEFWMIEPEMAFCDLRGDMALAQDFIQCIVMEVLERCGEDIDFFDQWIEKGLRKKLEALVKSSFEAMTYTEAVAALAKSGKSFEYQVSWGADLQSEHERYLTEELVGRPLFVIDYPKEIKAFYMRQNDDDKTVAAMDLLVPQVGEIIGGSQREDRLDRLEAAMDRFGLDKQTYWWYLDLRRHGGVPHAGFGLGFERALMYLTGMQNIRDVIPFARVPGSAEF